MSFMWVLKHGASVRLSAVTSTETDIVKNNSFIPGLSLLYFMSKFLFPVA